jgi:hypothetical protein
VVSVHSKKAYGGVEVQLHFVLMKFYETVTDLNFRSVFYD